MIIEEVAQFIQANGLGTYDPDEPNGDIFLEAMPDEPDSAICLYSEGGAPADVATSLARPGFGVTTRGTADPRSAAARASALLTLLNKLHGMQFIDGGTRVMLCQCRQSEPVHIGPDENGRHEYTNDFSLITGGE